MFFHRSSAWEKRKSKEDANALLIENFLFFKQLLRKSLTVI